jgi:hypothetical protein
MWTGRRFRLRAKILAVGIAVGERTATYIPAGETLLVIGGPRPTATRLVDISWKGRDLCVFAVDLEARGEDLGKESGAGA